MSLFLDEYRIESSRMPLHDYGPGLYFVTICTKGRTPSLGRVENSRVVPSKIGDIVSRSWMEIPAHFPDVRLDRSVIMPDHFHGIIAIESTPGRDVACNVSTRTHETFMSVVSPRRGSLPVIIRFFKSAVTRWCGQNGYRDFAWQSRYYDHLVRNDHELDLIRSYLAANPFQWDWKEHQRDHQWLRDIIRLETLHATSLQGAEL